MSVTFSGLASGIDSASIIESLIELEKAPITTMEASQTYLETKLDAYTEFNTLLDSLYTSVTGLNDATDLNSFAVTNTGSEYCTISTTSLAEAGSYSVEIVSLAQQQKDISSSYVADTGATSLSGILQLGTKTLDYDSVTLSGLVETINEGDYSVTASMIDDGSGNGYRLMLTADTAGEEVAIIGTGSIVMDTASDGHTIDGTKAHLVVDGIDYYSSSNTVTNALKGSTITLLAASDDGAGTVNIASDAEEANGGIDQNGNPATDLFTLVASTNPLADPWDGAAASIAIAFGDLALIAAGTTGTTADNSLCLDIAALRETTSINGATYTEEYARIAAKSGLLVSSNEQRLSASSDMLDALNAKRDSVSGVSTDEEMALLIQYQAGYEAASNYISMVKEMLDTLLHM